MDAQFQARADTAVFSKLDSSLRRIQEDLADAGLSGLELEGLAEPVRTTLGRFIKPCEGDAEVLAQFGSDPSTAPASLARSLTIFGLRAWLKLAMETLEQLEKAEDAKLDAWVAARFGDNAAVSFGNISVRTRPAVTSEQLVTLKLARQLLDANQGTLRDAAAKAGGAGIDAFIGDFATAVLSSDRMRQLLTDLWELESADEIDEVLKNVALGEHLKPVTFYADLLKALRKAPKTEQQEALAKITGEEDVAA